VQGRGAIPNNAEHGSEVVIEVIKISHRSEGWRPTRRRRSASSTAT
jgi:hypothetical protein